MTGANTSAGIALYLLWHEEKALHDERKHNYNKKRIAVMKTGYAATIGFFDGVHRGHRFLLKQLKFLAAERGLKAMAVTFDRHPRTVVTDHFVPSLLTTQEEKLALLSEAFDGEVIVLPFTKELSSMTAKEFMLSVLQNKLNTSVLLMGYNHRFGHGGGTQEEYVAWGKEAGIDVLVAEKLNGEKVSSSRIRGLISDGDIETANAMLGYRYFLMGKVTEGKKIGRTIGFPTANLTVPEDKLLPACGAYAIQISLPDGTKRGGMLCIGHRPTIEANGKLSIEANIFDFIGNLYGERLRLDLISRLRGERQFASLDDLHHQLTEDAILAKEMINKSA